MPHSQRRLPSAACTRSASLVPPDCISSRVKRCSASCSQYQSLDRLVIGNGADFAAGARGCLRLAMGLPVYPAGNLPDLAVRRDTVAMSRAQAILAAERYFDDGRFFEDLARRVAIPTESQNPERAAALAEYLEVELAESLERMGFACRIVPNPSGNYGPFLLAERIEDPTRPTVLSYAHGDVIRAQEGEWRAGLEPWTLKREGERLYGRGTADNKGQHTVHLAALESVLRTRGPRGCN